MGRYCFIMYAYFIIMCVFCDLIIRVDQTRKGSERLLLLPGTRTLQTGGKRAAALAKETIRSIFPRMY